MVQQRGIVKSSRHIIFVITNYYVGSHYIILYLDKKIPDKATEHTPQYGDDVIHHLVFTFKTSPLRLIAIM
jgi:hypothetical protein